MRIELLELKRACFCLPLRYSLLFCSYGRLICSILDTRRYMKDLLTNSKDNNIFFYIKFFFLALESFDVILVVIFIVGAHKKSIKLLKTFYFYDIGLLILLTLICTGFLIYVHCTAIEQFGFESYFELQAKRILISAAYFFLGLAFKVYILLLVRSEIIKLGNNTQFRFVNNAAESECTMEYNRTGDEEQRLAKTGDVPFEIKDNCTVTISKLKNTAESNMKDRKLGDADIETEKLSDEDTCKSKSIIS